MATSSTASQRQEFARPTSRDDFQIAIVCALPLEYDAISLLIDQVWDVKGDQHPFGRAPGDPNTYRNGRISSFNVVLVLLPNMGKVEAAGATASLRSSYPNISLVLVIGICGGMPFTREKEEEILLGDVIISNILIQYDFGRQLSDRFLVKDSIEDSLGRPTQHIRSMLRLLEVESIRDNVEDDAAQYLQILQRKHDGNPKQRKLGKYKYPGAHKDKLFDCSYEHKHHGPSSSSSDCSLCAAQGSTACERSMGLSCDDLRCDLSRLVHRERLVAAQMQISSDQPAFFPLRVFVGRMGSGDGVIRSAKHRQELAERGVSGVEMEGAGVWDQLPCIVIKGVCDYADSHKNKGWQDYAAATAASVAKAVLEHCATPLVTGRDPSSYCSSGSGHHAVVHGTVSGSNVVMGGIHSTGGGTNNVRIGDNWGRAASWGEI